MSSKGGHKATRRRHSGAGLAKALFEPGLFGNKGTKKPKSVPLGLELEPEEAARLEEIKQGRVKPEPPDANA